MLPSGLTVRADSPLPLVLKVHFMVPLVACTACSMLSEPVFEVLPTKTKAPSPLITGELTSSVVIM